MQSYLIKELNVDTWNDFEKLFEKHKGVRGGCWCLYHRCTSSQFNKMTKGERKKYHKELTFNGQGHGIIIYDKEIPIAWCQFGPASVFVQYDRGREYSKLMIEEKLKPNWRISCIFVDKDRRKENLSRIALKSAVKVICDKGGGVIEAFPLHLPESKRPQYTGSVQMYKELGFEEVTTLGKNNLLMRLVIK